jgi:hypothetical protein
MLKSPTSIKLLFIVITLTALALLPLWPPPWSQGAALLLLIIWPTYTWSQRQNGPLAERLVIAGGFVILINALLVMLLIYLPGPLPRWLQLISHWFVAILPLTFKQRAGNPESKPDLGQLAPILLTLLMLVTFRLPNLGYAEFQGDEGVIMARAAGIIMGDDAELFLHQKGPAEILVPLGYWNLTGVINELSARLLFAWSATLALLAVICLARRWFQRPAGLLAGIIFAVSGFTVAFGRIVQYQSLVMLWGALALLHMSRYRRSKRLAELLLAAAFLAGGLLAHYDAILIVPAVAALWLFQMPRLDRARWRHLVYAIAVGALTLAAFYVPFLLNPNFGRTGTYLVGARLGAGAGRGLLSWSGPAVWQMLTFYNSIYYVCVLALLVLVGVRSLFHRRAHLAAFLYIVVPLLFYLFIVADPRTHVYTIIPGASILAAVGAVSLARRLQATAPPLFYPVGLALFGLFGVVSAYYVYLLFIDHTPERQRTWSENRPEFYPASWAEPPVYGLFGFPHQAGWRVVADLLPTTAYPYASNEEEEITNWYMAQAPRTHCPDFQTFILTEHTQDEIPYERTLLGGLDLQYRVTVNGHLAMQIYGRQPIAEVRTIEAALASRWLAPADVAPPLFTGAYPVEQTFGDNQVRLLGYDLNTWAVSPGQDLVVTLYWQALAPFDRNYQTFVHLLVDGEILVQHDGAPECDINPTTRWEPGQVIPDPHLLHIPADAGAGPAELITGMYDLLTLDRMLVAGENTDVVFLDKLAIGELGD